MRLFSDNFPLFCSILDRQDKIQQKKVSFFFSEYARLLAFLVLSITLLVASQCSFAAIALRAASSNGINSATGGLAISVPSGTVAYDVMIASITWRTNTPILVAPAGWTFVRETNQVNGGGASNRLATYLRIATGSEPASYTWYFSGGTFSGAAGGITSFSGVDINNPIDVEGGNTTGNSFNHTANSITTTVADDMIITAHEFPSATTNWSAPTGMAEMVDVASIPRPNTVGIALSMNHVSQAAIGATGNKTAIANPSSTDAGYGAAHILALLTRALPATPTVDTLSTSDTTPTITGTFDSSDAGDGFVVTVNAVNYPLSGPDLNNSGDSWSLTISSPLSNGIYDVVAVATNVTGDSAADNTTNELIISGTDWNDYAYIEQLLVTTGPTGPDKRYNGYTVRLANYDTQSLISSGRLQADCDDLRVVRDNSGTLVEVDRHLIDCNSSSSDIRFMLQADITDSTTDTSYYLYYGNPSAGSPDPVTTTNVYRWYDDAAIDRSGDYTRGRVDAWHGDGWDNSLSWNAAGYYTYDNGDNFSSGYRIAVDERDALIEAEFYHTACYPNNMTSGVMLRGIIDSGSGGSESSSHYYSTNRGHNASCDGGYSEDGDIIKSTRTTIAVDGSNLAAIATYQWRKMALSAWGINATTLNYWDNDSGWPALGWPDAGSLHISGQDSDYDGRGFAAIMTVQDRARLRNIVVRRFVDPEPTVVTIPLTVNPDHYSISYPQGNPGITCEANAVMITAHDAGDAVMAPSAGTEITLSTSLVADGWSLKSGNGTFTAPNRYTFDGTESAVEFWLRKTTATASPHIDIDVSNGSATDNDGDAIEDANAEFSDTAFRFFSATGSISHQIAGKPSSVAPNNQTLQLRAIETNTTTQACEAALQGTTAIQLAYECNDPTACTGSNLLTVSAAESRTISRNNSGSISSYTSVNMAFDSNGIAPFSFYYNDAGKIRLYARKSLSADDSTAPPTAGAILTGSSNQFVVRPFGFYLSNLTTATDATTANIFARAGNGFTLSLTAKIWVNGEDTNNDGIPDNQDDLVDNLTTANFGNESSAQAVSLSHSKVLPTGAGTSDGALGGDTTPTAGGGSGDFSLGVASNIILNWSEVGIIDLVATLGNYLNSAQDIQSTKNSVGRFIPHHFDIADNTPDFTDSCNTFSYLNQPFVYGNAPVISVTAKARGGSTTQNYGGGTTGGNGFWKLNSSLARSFVDGHASAPSATLSVITAGSVTLANESDFDGFGTLSQTNGISGDLFLYSKNSTELPFDADVDITYSAATLTDEINGACYDPDDDLICDPYTITISSTTSVSTELRYGRMVLLDAYGSELNALNLPFALEYWKDIGSGNSTYSVADDDTCSLLNSSDVILSNYSGNLASGETVVSSISLSNGKGNITLSAPGNGNDGTVCVEYDLNGSGSGNDQSWLQDSWNCSSKSSSNPLGHARFGIFPGNRRQIYLREQY